MLSKLCPWVRLICLGIGLLGAAAPLTAREDQAARVFLIDGAHSEIVVLLFKRGVFSAFAHDHVLVSRNARGRVILSKEDIAASKVRITVPLASFEVDELDDRARENLRGKLAPGDREEIRATMLGPGQLDMRRFPNIEVTTAWVEGNLPHLTVYMKIRIKGTVRNVAVPVRVEISGNTLTADGEVELLQSEFGIEPFSAYLGTVGVEDLVRLRFHIQAREQQP
ncbi:MAG: YceI family protein [SAR324 cluster bacterium]|nr:YceI family protein [SAR324 cluster bacterium]